MGQNRSGPSIHAALALLDTANSSTLNGTASGADGNTIIITRAALGDGDLSTIVDASDFDVWFSHIHDSTSAYAAADFNNSGIVDAADFDIWFSHVGIKGFSIIGDSGLKPGA